MTKIAPFWRGLVVFPLIATAPPLHADEFRLEEAFAAGHTYRTNVQVKIAGNLVLPTEKGKQAQSATLAGASRLTFDERVLEPAEASSLRTIRTYREVQFKRTLGTQTQDAGIRPSVRRMVVIRKGEQRAPFSPDGPLTWGEIDVVRTDVFTPTLVPGLLPGAAVKPGQSWKATAAAVTELTSMQKIESGDLTVEFAGETRVDGKRMARLRISGTITGVNEDGPNRQTLDGTAFFDLDANLLTYLSIRGAHELLDGASGRSVGAINGHFIMTRTPLAEVPADLSDASLRGLTLIPNSENTLLLYDDPALGVRFLYPRAWRVGAVQGKQVTLDHAGAGGILITVEPADKVPTAEAYLREVTAFLQKEKARVAVLSNPARVREAPVALERFALDVAFEQDRARMEYAVLKQTEGGATVAARLPATASAELLAEVERIVRSLTVTKAIK
jgi:hypothetical protein